MRPHLIETLRVDPDGRLPLLPWHLERLARSSAALNYRWSPDAVQRAIARAAAGLPEGRAHRLRVLLADRGSVDIETSPHPGLPAVPRVVLARERLPSTEPLLRHKTTHRPWYDAATGWLARHPDYLDVLFLNERGELCEGSRCNVYVFKGGRWLTPPVAAGLLPGVQRAALLDDEAVEEAALTEADVLGHPVRLSNALRGWFDVVLDDSDRV